MYRVQLIAYTLFILFVSQTVIFSLHAFWRLHEHRSIIRTEYYRLHPDNSFTEKELKNAIWLDSQEFELNGKHYDVLDRSIVDGIQIIHAFSDSKEDRLLDLQKHANQGSDHSKLPLQKKIFDDYISNENSYSFINFYPLVDFPFIFLSIRSIPQITPERPPRFS